MMKWISILVLILISVLHSCNNNLAPLTKSGLETSYNSVQAPFFHGVASGDPLHDAVIIWTRVTPELKETIPVKWEISADASFESILQSGIMSTNHLRDYTVKVDVARLNPGTTYFYRFIARGVRSPVGKTRTLPAQDVNEISLGIVSCSNYEFGYFNAYDGLVDQDVDVVLHLGDYIYEYGPDEYGDEKFTRKHLPPKELISLGDYRTRYAQYRLDESLQRAHQNLPFILIWDDHEIANNAFATGAQNHQENEGSFYERKKIARQAYYEWQPIRDNKTSTHYRKFSFGNLAEIFMLDERYTGRQAPPESNERRNEVRTMLGNTQLNWFKKGLSSSKSKWKIIGNQVIFSPCDRGVVRPSNPINLDAWDGYAQERDDIISFLNNQHISNAIFVTGDTHASWAFEVPENYENYNQNKVACAIEIATPSITSSNWNDYGNSDAEVIMAENALLAANPHLSYVNGRDHGFTILRLNNKRAIAEWYYTENIKAKESNIYLAHMEEVFPDNLKLKSKLETTSLAITNVSIIPMTGSNDVLKNQTVEIQDGRITYIGSRKTSIKNVIDGSGKYLIPGLTEMHAHIPTPQDGDESIVEETLFLYLSQGVTTIRGMLGHPYHLELRARVNEGELLGPRIFTSSPSLNGNTVTSPEEAIKKVRQYKRDGYDFLKIHPGIQLHVWEALEKAAEESEIPFAGHVPVAVGIRRALNSGYATVDHLDGYIEGIVPEELNVDRMANGFFGYNFTSLADTSLIKGLVQMTIRNDVAIVPTQTLFTRWFSPIDATTLINQEEMQYMSPETRFNWRQNKTRILSDESYSEETWEQFMKLRNAILSQLYKQGVMFLLGSDAPQVMNVPGFSIHHEMRDMSEFEMSNYDILKSGTANPAQFFNSSGKFGSIRKGAFADMVLLNSNPLERISNARDIEAVFVKGELLSKDYINENLKKIANKNKGE